MNTLSGDTARQKIWSLVKDIKVALLASSGGEDKALHARPMMALGQDFDGTLWFFTDADSRKVSELKAQPRALLTYSDTKANHYVSISGTATPLRDQSKIDELWNDRAKPWFPSGPTDPNLILIRFEAEDAEFWEGPGMGLAEAYVQIKAFFTGETVEAEAPETGATGAADMQGGAGAIDIYEYLTRDHQKVAALIDEALAAEEPVRRQTLFKTIKTELLLHFETEEETFYRAITAATARQDVEDKIEHAHDEHDDVRDLLADLTYIDPSDERWLKQMHALKDDVSHHVAEEQGEVFAKARTLLSEDHAVDLARDMERLKRQQRAEQGVREPV